MKSVLNPIHSRIIMNLKQLSSVVAVALVVAVTGCNKAGKLSEESKFKPPTGPVELKVKWTPDEQVVQSMDMKMKAEVNVPGRPEPMQQDMSMGQKFALKVLNETPEGGHELQLEFLSAQMSMEMGGKKMFDYDSSRNSGADSTNPVAAMFGKIIGSKIQFYLDTSNNVERVEGVEDLVNKITSGGPAAAVGPLKSMFSEGYFKQMMSSSRFLPTTAVAPGDSWQKQLEFPMDMFGTMVLDYTFTFQGWEKHGSRMCARLEFQGNIKTKPGGNAGPMGMTMNIKDGTTSGVSWFDPELGIVVDSTMDQKMAMEMTIPKNPNVKQGPGSQPQTVSTKIDQQIQIKLDSVK